MEGLEDDTEKLYSPTDYKNRGPEVTLAEFVDMQDEALRIQQGFFQMIQDARTIGLDDSVIKLTEHSKIVVDEYIYDPNPSKSKLALNMASV